MLEYREELIHEKQNDHYSVSKLYLSIRNLLLDKVTNQIKEDSPFVKNLVERLRCNINIHNMMKRNNFQKVAGVDAGSQILPLASRQYAIISALAYLLPNCLKFFLEPEAFMYPYALHKDNFRSIVNVRREAKLFETASSFLDKGYSVDLLLVDGPLVFSNLWSFAGNNEDRKRLLDSIHRLLNLCMEMGVTIAGVVKRPSARYLVHYMDLQFETELTDSFLMLNTLRPGERTDIFSPMNAMRKIVKTPHFMDEVNYSIYSFYGRFAWDWSIPPIRIDIPTFCLASLDDIADYCYFSSVWHGIPLPITKADEEVKISRQFIGEIYRDIITQLNSHNGEVSHLAPIWGESKWMGV